MTVGNKLAIVGLSGLLFTGAAVGLTGMASAQDGTSTQETTPTEAPSEHDAVFDRFDQCLSDNGIDVGVIDGHIEALEVEGEALTDEQRDEKWEAIEASMEEAFETCDPILEELSGGVRFFGGLEFFGDIEELGDSEFFGGAEFFGDFEELELSAEDEAVLDRHEQCLIDNGIDGVEGSAIDLEEFDGELTDEQWESIDAEFDKIFDTCDPILDDLSEDAEFLFEDCPDEHDEHDEAGENEEDEDLERSSADS